MLIGAGHKANNPIVGSKGYKYKNITASLVSGKIQVGMGISRVRKLNKLDKKVEKVIPCAMILNENKISYVHWDDPNELVDRLRLLEASRQTGHNAHDNEILSIIEEFHEAGFIN